MMLPYPPSGNRYWRHFRGRTVRSSDAGLYRVAVRNLARSEGLKESLLGPIRVCATLHPRLTKKGEASKTRLDLDNCVKVLLDALQGIAYDNDRQVEDLRILLGGPVEGGGISVVVESISESA